MKKKEIAAANLRKLVIISVLSACIIACVL